MTRPSRLLSHHSSNPLELRSTDPYNNSLRRKYYTRATRENTPGSSDDPLYGRYEEDEADTTILAGRTRGKVSMSTVVHDDDMETDDELLLSGTDGVKDEIGGGGTQEAEDVNLDASEGNDIESEEEDEAADDNDDDLTDEETTINDRPPEERAEILTEIRHLTRAIPGLSTDYQLIDRIGSGTFSSVYKAIDLGYHTKWDNTPWHGRQPPTSSAHYQSAVKSPDTKVFVAVKRIYVTSAPDRIRNEIAILEECRGCRHVSQLITAFRHQEQIVVIMPYERNEDFRDFFKEMPMEGIKSYMRCLFRALRDIHARRIIHRDVKPANFLFDPRTGIGTLCDFGLACYMNGPTDEKGRCFHSSPTLEHPHGRYLTDYDRAYIIKVQKDAKMRNHWPSDKVGVLERDKDKRPISKANRAGTRGFRAPEVLLKCSDQNGAVDVWSAGIILLSFLSKKFPLFSANDDVEALMELAAILGRKKIEKAATLHSRLFGTNVPDVTIDGLTSWGAFVEELNPDVMDEVPEVDPRHWPYSKWSAAFVAKETDEDGGASREGTPPLTSSSCSEASSSPPRSGRGSSIGFGVAKGSKMRIRQPTREEHRKDIEDAFSFLEKVLHHESTRRATPKEALEHPFLSTSAAPFSSSFGGEDDAEDEDMDSDAALGAQNTLNDDIFFPHPIGLGRCGSLHAKNEVQQQIVSVLEEVKGEDGQLEERMVTRQVVAGLGVPIGNEPCEFHQNYRFEDEE